MQRLANWLIQHPELFGDPTEARQSPGQGRRVRSWPNRPSLSPPSRPPRAWPQPCSTAAPSTKTSSFAAPTRPRAKSLRAACWKLSSATGRAGSVSDRSTGSGRPVALAQQMTDPAITPFVPRVMVNRVWHHLFGRGIVASVDNFGVLGEKPTHPELLDYLADQFVKDGWSMKRLIRRLVLSRTYQMSSRPERAGQASRSGQPAAVSTCAFAGWKGRRSATRSCKFPAVSIARCTARRCRSI